MPDNTIKLYAHQTCPQVPAVLAMLKGAKVNYQYINIHEDGEARQYVREVNNGYESVPTLLFPDGTTLTEPSTGVLRAKLEAIGYHVPLQVRILANIPTLIIGAMIFFAVLRFVGVL